MNDRERRLIRDLISEANNALKEQDNDEGTVATFLDGVTVQAVTVLYCAVMLRQGMSEEGGHGTAGRGA